MISLILIITLLPFIFCTSGSATYDFSTEIIAEETWKHHPRPHISALSPIEAYDTFASFKFLNGKMIQKNQIIEIIFISCLEKSKWEIVQGYAEGIKVDSGSFEWQDVIDSIFRFYNLKSYRTFSDMLDWKGAMEANYLKNGIPAFFERLFFKKPVSVSQPAFSAHSKFLLSQTTIICCLYKFYLRFSRQVYAEFNLMTEKVDFLEKMLEPDSRFMSFPKVKASLDQLATRFNHSTITDKMTTVEKEMEISRLFWLTITSDEFCEATFEAFTMYANQIQTAISSREISLMSVVEMLLLPNYIHVFAEHDLFGLKQAISSASDNYLEHSLSTGISTRYLEQNPTLLDEFVCKILVKLPKDLDKAKREQIFVAILEASNPHSLFVKKYSNFSKQNIDDILKTVVDDRRDLLGLRPAMFDIASAYSISYGAGDKIEIFIKELSDKTDKFDPKKLVEMGEGSYTSRNWKQLLVGAGIVIISCGSIIFLWSLSITQPWKKKKLKD